MDQFSAHMDRGWDLVQRGDIQGAELSAKRALDLESDSPEARNLLGFVAALGGDFEEAAEHYEQAIALDDTYLEAILNAAEICIHPLGQFKEAERLCDDALELVEDADERVDALLLKFDALVGQNRLDAAKQLCSRFPRGPFENPAHPFLMGRALFEVGDVEHAAPLIEEAASGTSDNAEAFYYLALVRDKQGRAADATAAFLKTRALDIVAEPLPWALSSDAFRSAVLAACRSLPEALQQRVKLEEIYLDALPGIEVVVDGVDPRSLLLLDEVGPSEEETELSEEEETGLSEEETEPAGAPAEEGAPSESASLRVFVYQRNVERLIGSVEQLVPELTLALQHELEAYCQQTEEPDSDPTQH